MTIASEISKLQKNLINAYSSIESKGGTLPANQNFDNLSSSINTITGGSSNIITAINNTGELISKDDKVWINEENGSYELINLYSIYYNFNTVGSPNVNEDTGLVSNFSTSNYLQLPQIFNPGTSDFEIVIAGIPEENSSYVLAGTQNSTIALSLQKYCFLSTGGSTYNITLPITSTYSSGQKTWLKIVRQGNTFTRYSSLDGTTWITESSVTNSRSLNSVTLNIGFYGYEPTISYIGTVDLSETYIKINDSIWWKPYEIKLSDDFNEDILTGFANEDISNNSSGQVRALLS